MRALFEWTAKPWARFLLSSAEPLAMPTNAAYLADLEKAIRMRYHCSATYRQTDFVHEKTADNETVWIGNVELFDLADCKDASRCYAWENIANGTQIVTILQSSFVDSALRAVQTAIYAGVQAPVAVPGDDTEIFMKRLEKAKKALHELEVQIKPEDLEAIMQTTRQINGSISRKVSNALDRLESQISKLQAEMQNASDLSSNESRVHILEAQKETQPKSQGPSI